MLSINIIDLFVEKASFSLYLFSLFSFLLSLVASVFVLRKYRGVEVPVWLLVVWVISIVGPVLAILCVCLGRGGEDDEVADPYRLFLAEDASHKYLSKSERKVLFRRWKEQRSRE